MNPTSGDSSYGQVAISLGYVTAEQVQDCLSIQAKMREMGLDTPLGEILGRKGYLTPQQQSGILKKMGVQTSPIPGYALLGKIGQGGMGVVYKAVQTSVNRTVAIKILSNTATKDKTYVARFLGEAQAAASLSHKNLISAIDVGFSNGLYYFVMEYVTGKSCREILNVKGPFVEKPALDIALQMTEVLDHIHQHQMVHRDIKPENILLTAEGLVKLCDLGLAKSTTSMEQSLTQEGLAVGTPYFMSPEQIRGDKDVDIRADLYSLGATLFFLITGQPPYQGKSAAETMTMHLNAPTPDLRRIASGVSDDFAAVTAKLMAKDRTNRYQTPLELLEDLRKLKQGSAPHHARQHMARAHAAHKEKVSQRLNRRKSMPWWPIAVGAGVLVAGGAAFFLFRPAPEKQVVVVREPAPVPRVEPARAPEKKDDPQRTNEAARLFSSAVSLYEQDRWGEALAELGKLAEPTLSNLQYVQEKGASIGEMKGICEQKMKDALAAESRLAEEARVALRNQRWKAAHDALQQLVQAGKSGFRHEMERADRELQATAGLEELRAARDAGRWTVVLARAIELAPVFGATETAKAYEPEIRGMAIRAVVEDKVIKALSAAHAKAVTGNWVEVSKHLAEVESHRETDAYRTKQEEIRDLRGQMAKANEKLAEEAAAAGWIQSVKDYGTHIGDRKYEQAAEVLRDYARDHGATAAYKSHVSEIDAKISDAGKRRLKDKDDEARRIWTQVQADMKKSSFDTVADGLQRLLGDLADTSTTKSNDTKIRQLKTQLEQSGRAGSPVLVEMDFEDLPGVWSTNGGAEARNAPDEPFQGRRSAKLDLGAGGRALHPIAGLRQGVEMFAFYTKTRTRAAPVTLTMYIYDDTAAPTATWQQTFQVTWEWKAVQLKAIDFKPYNEAARIKKYIDWNHVRLFQFQQAPGDASNETPELFIDTLRVIATPIK